MTMIIIDASMALAWLFKRSDAKEAEIANRLLLAMTSIEALVPSLWHVEIANALLVGERRCVITEAQSIDYLNKLSRLPVMTDDGTQKSCRDLIMAFAREYKLTAYDATYLELALRKNALLATFDVQLAAAMRKAGGTLWGD